jgi:hypothetical protein
MTILEVLVTGLTLVVCGFGVAWLYKDIQHQVELMEKANDERCEGLVEDNEDEE